MKYDLYLSHMPGSITRSTHYGRISKRISLFIAVPIKNHDICLPRGLPTKQSTFKRAGTSIHYPYSPSLPESLRGLGRCVRQKFGSRLHSSTLVKSLPPWTQVSSLAVWQTCSHESLQSQHLSNGRKAVGFCSSSHCTFPSPCGGIIPWVRSQQMAHFSLVMEVKG